MNEITIIMGLSRGGQRRVGMGFAGQRATIMGLGHFGGGAGAARWLARQGAVVTVSDVATEAALVAGIESLRGEPIAHFHLGGHQEEDFRGADLVVVNPAVKPGSPLLEVARKSGARLTSEIELFLEACPASTIAVTGSNGKSTTAAMTAAILRAAGRRTWLGGNLGGSLLEELGNIRSSDWVVLELSSFQLWHLAGDGRVTHVAVATNCTPNHLDWHGDMGQYVAAKQRILVGQMPGDVAVLNCHDPEVASWGPLVRGRMVPLLSLSRLPSLLVEGDRNRINAACAGAAAEAVGCDEAAIRLGLESFRGLPQRLEWFSVVGGRRFYNDSAATTPESTIAALESLTPAVWLLAGGRDKGFDFGALADTVVRRARGAALFGSARLALHSEVMRRDSDFLCSVSETMAEALRWCWERSRPGEVIVLSPGCASTDQFCNFRQRGEVFVDLVGALANCSDW